MRFLCFLLFLLSIQASFAQTVDFSTKEIKKIETEYCNFSPEQKATYIQNTDKYAHILPIIKKPYDYNKLTERDKKKAVEEKFFYDPHDFPEQEQSFKLGLIFSGIKCEILDRSKAFTYLSQAGRKPESYLIIAKIYYNENNLERTLFYLEKSARLGLEKAFGVGFIISRSHAEYRYMYEKFHKLYKEFQINNHRREKSVNQF